jgi:hypothetical protein
LVNELRQRLIGFATKIRQPIDCQVQRTPIVTEHWVTRSAGRRPFFAGTLRRMRDILLEVGFRSVELLVEKLVCASTILTQFSAVRSATMIDGGAIFLGSRFSAKFAPNHRLRDRSPPHVDDDGQRPSDRDGMG